MNSIVIVSSFALITLGLAFIREARLQRAAHSDGQQACRAILQPK